MRLVRGIFLVAFVMRVCYRFATLGRKLPESHSPVVDRPHLRHDRPLARQRAGEVIPATAERLELPHQPDRETRSSCAETTVLALSAIMASMSAENSGNELYSDFNSRQASSSQRRRSAEKISFCQIVQVCSSMTPFRKRKYSSEERFRYRTARASILSRSSGASSSKVKPAARRRASIGSSFTMAVYRPVYSASVLEPQLPSDAR